LAYNAQAVSIRLAV